MRTAAQWQLRPAPTRKILWWLPRLSFLLFLAAVVALLWFLDKSEKEEQRTTLISDMLWIEQNLHFLFSHNEELLAHLDPQRIDQAEVFEANARTLVANNSGMFQVIRLDRDGHVRAAFPPSKADAARVGENQDLIPSPSVSRLADSLGRPVYSPAYPVVQGDWQFEVHVPVFLRGQHAGTVVGIYSIRRLLEESIPWWLAERYRIGIFDQGNLQLGMRSKVAPIAPGSEYQMSFEPPGHGLILRATPYQSPAPLASRLLSASLVMLAILVLGSLWVLRRDVLRRQAAEDALHAEYAFRKAMEDSVQTGLRARDLEGRITYVNPAFCRMVGWSVEELVGLVPPMPYWADEYLEETRAMHDRVMAGQAPSEGFEMRFKRRNGELFDVLIHESPLIDNEGRQTGWMGSVVDITEHKRAQELSRQQEERLQASARLVTMGEMASSLAHELNQPLAAIASYTAGCRNLIAADSTALDEIDGALAKCQDQAQRAGNIIRRIYEFAQRHEPKSEPCDLGGLLSDIITLIEADARRHKVSIVRDIPAELPILEADRILLGQAILNLMKNGIDAMQHNLEETRILTVAARSANQHVLISITDNGCGIAVDDAQQLFEPFYTTKSEGLGVGLNICRSVVEAHQGRLWFEPNPGSGTVFHISLPVAT
jgi:two-component system sensor histidine kinase DctS